MRHPLTILFGYIFVFLYGMCLYPFLNHPRKHYDCLIALVVQLCARGNAHVFLWLAGTVAHSNHPLLYCVRRWNLPVLCPAQLSGRVFQRRCRLDIRKSRDGILQFHETNRIMAWFTGNIGYHHIHHLNARIPFYRLPEVMKKIPELQTPKTTSLNPMEIIRCLRLKVWDVESQRMVVVGHI